MTTTGNTGAWREWRVPTIALYTLRTIIEIGIIARTADADRGV
jgi:hypothetical protein